MSEEKGLQLDNSEKCTLMSRIAGKATAGRAVIMVNLVPNSKARSFFLIGT